VRLQPCPGRKSAFARDHALRVVQEQSVRRHRMRACRIQPAKGVRILRAGVLQQRTCTFTVMFEIEPGQSILLLCLCPLSRPKEGAMSRMIPNEQVGGALSADRTRPETRSP
jgi:hypothetical protein